MNNRNCNICKKELYKDSKDYEKYLLDWWCDKGYYSGFDYYVVKDEQEDNDPCIKIRDNFNGSYIKYHKECVNNNIIKHLCYRCNNGTMHQCYKCNCYTNTCYNCGPNDNCIELCKDCDKNNGI